MSELGSTRVFGRHGGGARFREIVKVLPDGRHAVDYRKFHKVTAAEGAREDSPERTPARGAR